MYSWKDIQVIEDGQDRIKRPRLRSGKRYNDDILVRCKT